MTRLLPCLAVAVALATATTTRVTMDDEPAFFAAALARDDAAARWRAEASAANVRALGVAPGRVVLLFAAPALSEEARALAALGYRVEAYDLVGDAAADVELRLVDRFLDVTSAVEDGFAFSWAVSPARALADKPILHMAGAAGRCGDRTLGAAAATCGFFKNEWVLRSPVHALCRDPAEFDYARPRARMQR